MGVAGPSFRFVFWLAKLVGEARNRHTVEEVDRTGSQLHEYFSSMLYEWSTAWGFTSSTSVTSFLDSLYLSSNPFSL